MDSTNRFTNRVDDYVKYRPGYPAAEILKYLEDKIGFTSAWEVADIGSGTGISTALFLNNGNKVYGVEPNDAMRTKAEELLQYPSFTSIKGTAETTNLPDNAVNLVVAGQAFHWFNPPVAKKEFARILKDDGYVVLIWNIRTVNSAFEKDYELLLQEFGTDYKEVGHKDIATEDKMEDFFSPLPMELKEFANNQVLDYEGVKGRLTSSSYIPTPDAPTYEPMLHKLKEIIDRNAEDGKVVFGYVTKVYIGKVQ
jgi:SAM-dependent methyltransferase